jgi:hypothetical protein
MRTRESVAEEAAERKASPATATAEAFGEQDEDSDECANDRDCSAGEKCGVNGVVDPCARNVRRQTRVCLAADAGAQMQLIAPCTNLPPAPEAGAPIR